MVANGKVLPLPERKEAFLSWVPIDFGAELQGLVVFSLLEVLFAQNDGFAHHFVVVNLLRIDSHDSFKPDLICIILSIPHRPHRNLLKALFVIFLGFLPMVYVSKLNKLGLLLDARPVLHQLVEGAWIGKPRVY